jgi:hypothetical protein
MNVQTKYFNESAKNAKCCLSFHDKLVREVFKIKYKLHCYCCCNLKVVLGSKIRLLFMPKCNAFESFENSNIYQGKISQREEGKQSRHFQTVPKSNT